MPPRFASSCISLSFVIAQSCLDERGDADTPLCSFSASLLSASASLRLSLFASVAISFPLPGLNAKAEGNSTTNISSRRIVLLPYVIFAKSCVLLKKEMSACSVETCVVFQTGPDPLPVCLFLALVSRLHREEVDGGKSEWGVRVSTGCVAHGERWQEGGK